MENEYQKSKPQYGEQGFKERVHGRIKTLFVEDAASALLPTGEVNAERFFELITGEGPAIESDVAWIYVSCANALAAMWVMEKQEQQQEQEQEQELQQDCAWDLLCEASFYLGTVVVTNRGEELFTETVVGTYKSAIAAEGGSSRHKQTNAMKTRAYEIMRSQAPWPSQARAVSILENTLTEEFGPDSLKNFEATITGWIKAMPDRLELIPSLRDRLK
ncbi:hypothetical protein ASC92_26710 [Variovorax sp. Root411]|nr:hypothetical protein ASC92_26710 [Variovorax sp. Root411]